jgi:hypothetical protein
VIDMQDLSARGKSALPATRKVTNHPLPGYGIDQPAAQAALELDPGGGGAPGEGGGQRGES